VVLAAVALVALAVWQRDATPVDLAKGTATATPGPILGLDPASVQEVEVAGPAGASVTLKRAAGGWEVDGAKASDTVSSTVNSLVGLTARQTLGAERNPEDYGFSTPTLTITLKTADGGATTLVVGDEVVGESGSSYLRLDQPDAPIHVVFNSELTTIKDWLETPPLAPTPTPEIAAPLEGTPEGALEGIGEGTPEATPEDTPEGTPEEPTAGAGTAAPPPGTPTPTAAASSTP
jgi:hypothetical protein